MKRFCFKCLYFMWVVAVWVLIGYLLNTLCFGAVRRNPPRYKVAPTNIVLRINGTNCWIRYMYDNLLHTNLIVMIEPFDPPPLADEPSTNNFTEADNE